MDIPQDETLWGKVFEQLAAADDWREITGHERYRRMTAAYDEALGKLAARDVLDRLAEPATPATAPEAPSENREHHLQISVRDGGGSSMGTMPSVPTVPDVPSRLVRRIAIDAEADERTAAQFLLGEPVRGQALVERLAAAVKKHQRALDSAKTRAHIQGIERSGSPLRMRQAAIAKLRELGGDKGPEPVCLGGPTEPTTLSAGNASGQAPDPIELSGRRGGL